MVYAELAALTDGRTREVVERSGRRVTVWKQHYRRNEALDCAVYALALAELVPRPARRRPRLLRV